MPLFNLGISVRLLLLLPVLMVLLWQCDSLSGQVTWHLCRRLCCCCCQSLAERRLCRVVLGTQHIVWA
jgi:hypothetical protein